MILKKKDAEFFVPDGKPVEEALKRTTHMAICAHQDDIELAALDGVIKCFGRNDLWFTGVVVTNGAGSARDDLYASYTDDDMQKVRKIEQKKAAFVGEYAVQFLLNYTSSEVKDPKNTDTVEEIKNLLTIARPKVVYTHNLADKHDTHVGTVCKTIQALRELPADLRPEKVYGCEVWRDLDWMPDNEKVVLDVSAHENIAAAVMGVFDSQICGGKRYDLAIMGRRKAHATFSESHAVDTATALSFAMDLTPLVNDPKLDLFDYVHGYINRFAEDVANRINKFAKK